VVAVEKEVGIPVWAAANADGEGDFGDAWAGRHLSPQTLAISPLLHLFGPQLSFILASSFQISFMDRSVREGVHF
jgi:hypothetical protein